MTLMPVATPRNYFATFHAITLPAFIDAAAFASISLRY